MNFIFCKLQNPQKTWISFFASLKTSKNMNFIFSKLKGGLFFRQWNELFGPNRLGPSIIVVWPRELVCLIGNCLENIFIIPAKPAVRPVSRFWNTRKLEKWKYGSKAWGRDNLALILFECLQNFLNLTCIFSFSRFSVVISSEKTIVYSFFSHVVHHTWPDFGKFWQHFLILR